MLFDSARKFDDKSNFFEQDMAQAVRRGLKIARKLP
jgi:hypothetical protein